MNPGESPFLSLSTGQKTCRDIPVVEHVGFNARCREETVHQGETGSIAGRRCSQGPTVAFGLVSGDPGEESRKSWGIVLD